MRCAFLFGLWVAFFVAHSLQSAMAQNGTEGVAETKYKTEVAEFEKKYDVELSLAGHEFQPEANKIAGVDSTEVDAYLPLFLSEFSLYPPEFTKRCGLKKIVLCKRLSYDGQFRSAIPGFRTDGIMFYDVEKGSFSPSYQRHVVHHEFFHLFDLKDDGKVYKDQSWAALNDPEFEYGDGGIRVYKDGSQGLITFETPGFFNKYSTAGVEEDKAEMFAYMVTRSEMVEQRSEVDPVVVAKTKQMKRLLEKFSPSMDEAFWNTAAKLDRKAKAKTASDPIARMNAEAEKLMQVVESNIAKSFLSKVAELPPVTKRSVFALKDGRPKRSAYLSDEEYEKLAETEKPKYVSKMVSDEEYYFTKYGSPLAFVRALDLVGQAGLDSLEDKKVVDFGFGSIGHLRAMALCGAQTYGIDVDLYLKSLYRESSDQGAVARIEEGQVKDRVGGVRLSFGSFPVDEIVSKSVGSRIDLFISKNTLKKGYIHPAQEVKPSRMISLGVSDQEFIKTVFDRLNSGGFFMIYNLHPRRTEPGDGYKTWSDGRSPFAQTDFTDAGFEVIEFDKDDTESSHQISKALGLDKHFDLDENFRAMYTLLKKP